MLIISFVDDAGMAAPNEESINGPVKELQDEGFNLEMEGDFTKCLGIGMEHRDDGSVCMTQKGPIKKTIATARMQSCHQPATFAKNKTLRGQVSLLLAVCSSHREKS